MIRKSARPKDAQTRAKISATIRANAAARGAFIWDDENIAALRKAYVAGGNAACMNAFPALRESQVYAAVRRYCLAGTGAHTSIRENKTSVWKDPDFNRRFMEALTGRSYTI